MPQREDAVHLFQRVANRAGRGVRPEVTSAILADLTNNFQRGEFFFRINPDGDIGLVVAQIDIIAGAVLLDQGVFEQQCFFFRVGDNGLNLRDFLH